MHGSLMNNRISRVHARSVWDSRGRPTVEAEVHLEGGAIGRAIAPAGASRGKYEAVDLRDGGARHGGMGVEKAVAAVNGEIAAALHGADVRDQGDIDAALCRSDGTPNKLRFGGNATVAVSMAAAHAAAAAEGVPLWRWLAQDGPVSLPLPEIQIFGGGAHAGRRTDIQDFMVMVPRAASIREVLEVTGNVYRAAGEVMHDRGRLAGTADEGGWWPMFDTNEQALETLVEAIERAGHRPGEDVFISLDIAASEFADGNGYVMALDDARATSAEMVERVCAWADRYPILSIEDPVGQDDTPGMVAVTQRLGSKIQIIGDDYLVTSAERVVRAAQAGACNAVLVKVNQAGSVSEARAALDAAQAHDWATIVSARSGETEDLTIVHLAVGWNARQLKVGSFARSERMAKWNELLRIEEAMGADTRFNGIAAFAPSVNAGLGA